MKSLVPQIVGSNGDPISSWASTQELRERSELMNSFIGQKKNVFQNSLEGLVSSFGIGRQDNITSLNPLFTSNIYAPLTTNFTLLSYLYKTHGILQTMIDEPVLDAFRDGIELTSKELDSSDIGELEAFAEETSAWESLKSVLMWGSLYGGSGLVINAGQDPEKPLEEKDIKRGNLEFYDADRWEFSGAFRSAEKFNFYGQKLDASRVITYGGKRAPRLLRVTLAGWGMSEFERVVEDFNVWLRGRNVLYEILDAAKIDVYSIKGYAETLALPGGEQVIRARIQATNSLKNFHNALILDSEDEYKSVPNHFQGMADIFRENRVGIACATRMPFTKLFGSAAVGGGMSNAGQDDMENYNAMITSRVRSPARPIIRKMLRLMQYAVFGKEYDLSFSFKPLRVLSAKEEEEIKSSKQTRYESLYDKRLLDSKEMGELLHKENLVPISTKAQEGLLPLNPEVPTTEQMFEPQGDEKNGKAGDTDRPQAS